MCWLFLGDIMEYEFTHDTITGVAKAIFSYEHQAMGPWLEVEVGNDVNKLTNVLNAMNDVKLGRSQDITIIGCEYSLQLSFDDVQIQPNALKNNKQDLPVELVDDDLHLDELVSASCGADDFRVVLMSWAKFTRMN